MSYSIAVLGKRRIAFATLTAILCTAAPAAAAQQRAASQRFGSRTLQKGMTGADVATLQEDLTIAGYQTLTTGVFSEGTKLHVQTFQARYHLSTDGVVGPTTVQQIKKVVKAAVERQAAEISATGASGLQATTPTSTTAAVPGTTTTTTPGTTTEPLAPSDSGGASAVPPPTDAPVEQATIDTSGLAVAPADAPMVIRNVIQAANQIAFTPYIYGGGHASFTAAGYDCSGSTSFALHGGGLISSPIDSSQFESYGLPGPGRWITLWANPAHVYMEVAGLFYDTAAQSSGNGNDRWSLTRISPRGGFVEIHPAGW